jgi:8-oxo-dGTP diphosphatase
MSIRVRAVIIQNIKLLALEREKAGDHFWCFPGGGVKDGESEKEALKRECKEEINVKIEVGPKIWQQDFKGDKINFYTCNIIEGEVGKGDGPEYQESDNCNGTHEPVWLDMEKLSNYDLRPNDLRDYLIKKA